MAHPAILASTNIIVAVQVGGGALDVSSTDAFQARHPSDQWVYLGQLSTFTNQPTIQFTHVGGVVDAANHFYADSFRFTAIPKPGALQITRTGTNSVLNWLGAFTLQSATTIQGPFSDVAGAITNAPYTNTSAETMRFYRLRN